MPSYIARFDRGPSERFEAANDAAALEYVRELMHDEGAEDGDSAYVFLANEGGRDDEEHIGDVTLGETDD